MAETFQVIRATDGQAETSLKALVRNGNTEAVTAYLRRPWAWLEAIRVMDEQGIIPVIDDTEEMIAQTLEAHRHRLMITNPRNNNTRFAKNDGNE